jgi:creatinine amidohydrolase
MRNGTKVGQADGVYGGDPHRASAELGQLGIDAIVSHTVQALKTSTAAH